MLGQEVDEVEEYKHLAVHTDNKLINRKNLIPKPVRVVEAC